MKPISKPRNRTMSKSPTPDMSQLATAMAMTSAAGASARRGIRSRLPNRDDDRVLIVEHNVAELEDSWIMIAKQAVYE